MNPSASDKVRIELDVATLAKLVEARLLPVEAFRCLDFQTKQRVWQLCLKTCAKCVHYECEARTSGSCAEACLAEVCIAEGELCQPQ